MIVLEKDQVIVFGAGNTSKLLLRKLDFNRIEIVAFADNDPGKWTDNFKNMGIPVIDPRQIAEYPYDYIIIGSIFEEEIMQQLYSLNVNKEKIIPYNLSQQDIMNYRHIFDVKELVATFMLQSQNYLEESYRLDSANFIREKFVNERGIIDTRHLFTDRKKYYQYIIDCVKELNDWDKGLFLEFGVYKGYTINLLSNLIGNKTKIYGFDSFEGLPEFWKPTQDKGAFNVNSVLPKVNENVELIKGWFDETLPSFAEEHRERFCSLIHIDCDLYSSTKTVFDNLKENIRKGTIIMFDELIGYVGWQDHEYRALIEFLNESGYSYKCIAAIYGGPQVAIQIQ